MKEIQKKPEPWYSAGLVDDSNIYEWEITIIGYLTAPFFVRGLMCGVVRRIHYMKEDYLKLI